MKKDSFLEDYIQKEIIQEEKNYERALETGKPVTELKRIQDRIHYLKSTYRQVKRRYRSPNDFSISD
jgi:hypothetical protein